MICWYFDSADLRIWGDASGLYSTIDAKEWSECPYLGMRSPFSRSHPSRGAWIEIKTTNRVSSRIRGRTPHGVRGLKSDPHKWMRLAGSRTPHGVRGLKFHRRHDAIAKQRRTPHGVRGLKSWQGRQGHRVLPESHPSRGAWIEIKTKASRNHGISGSHPSRGAWIEMPIPRRHPGNPTVAPLTGCVD